MVNLDYEKLKKLSVEEIYDYLNEDYINLFKSYNYIFKTYPEFSFVIKNILADIITKLPQSSNNYQNYLLKQSKVRLNKYVKNMLDGEDKLNIISSYIDLNLDESPNELKELKKLVRWLQIIDYIPDPSAVY